MYISVPDGLHREASEGCRLSLTDIDEQATLEPYAVNLKPPRILVADRLDWKLCLLVLHQCPQFEVILTKQRCLDCDVVL